MSTYSDATHDYVNSTRGVLSAANMLKIAISGDDQGDIDFAVDALANAADNYTGTLTEQEKFGFDELAQAGEDDFSMKERLSGDLLFSAMTDLEVANTLFVAGSTIGETAEPLGLEDLENATSELDDLTRYQEALNQDVNITIDKQRFGFDGIETFEEEDKFIDLNSAKLNYQNQVTQILNSLTSKSKKVIMTGFESVEDLDEKDLAKAISLVGETAKELPKIGKLISKGLYIVINALNKLVKLIGEKNTNLLKEKAEELLSEIKKGGSYLDVFLNYSFDIDESTNHISKLLANTSSDPKLIMQGTNQLANLHTRYTEYVEIMTRIINGLNTGKKVVGYFLPQATWMLVFGAFYFLVMDIAVLLGMDFADTTKIVRFVKGVLEISEEILT